MGNLKTLLRTRTIKKSPYEVPPIGSKDLEIIKAIWTTVEKDSAYYGFAMCTTLYKNHPEYAKYFEDEAIPEFVREAKVKKKFTAICDIMSALFINYNSKPDQRNYLLGYMAMVHKDMGLTIQDFENFVSSIVEALYTELPQLMSSEYVIVQIKYFNILSEAMLLLMEKQRANMEELLRLGDRNDKICSSCFTSYTNMIYSYPLKYWLYKKRYWEYRRAVWTSLDLGSGLANTGLNNPRKTKMQIRRKSVGIKRSIQRRQSKVMDKHVSSDSDQGTDNRSINRHSTRAPWLLSNLRKKKELKANENRKVAPLKTIREVQHDKILRDLKGIQESSSLLEWTQDYNHTSSPTQTSGNSRRGTVARERKREHDYSSSMVGNSFFT